MFISSRNLSFAIVLVTMVSSGTVFAKEYGSGSGKSKNNGSGSSKSKKNGSGSFKSAKSSSFVSVDYWAVVKKEHITYGGGHAYPGSRRLSVDRGVQNVDSQSGKRRGVRGVSGARRSLRSGEKTDASRPRQLEPAPDEAGINMLYRPPSSTFPEVGSKNILIADLYEDVDYDGDKNIDKLELVGGGDGIVSRKYEPIGSFNQECNVIDSGVDHDKSKIPDCKTDWGCAGDVCYCGDQLLASNTRPTTQKCSINTVTVCFGSDKKNCFKICPPQLLEPAPGCNAYCFGSDFSICETLCPTNTATFNCDITMCPDDRHCVYAVHETSIDLPLITTRSYQEKADADTYKVKVGPVNTINITAPITAGIGMFIGAIGQITMEIPDFQQGNVIGYPPNYSPNYAQDMAGEAELKAVRPGGCGMCIAKKGGNCCPTKFKVTLEYIPMDQKQRGYFSNTE